MRAPAVRRAQAWAPADGPDGSGVINGNGRRDPLPVHHLDVPPPLNTVPFAVGSFDALGPLSRASYPHRHTFYEIVLVTRGEGAHVIDFSAQPLRPPHLCVITPGQVHFWQSVTNLCGRIILFNEEFLLDKPGDREALRTLGERPWLHLARDQAAGFAALVEQMEREFVNQEKGFASVLQALLHVFIMRARRLPNAEPRASTTDRAGRVTQQFHRLLAEHAPAERSVRGYAARLGVSVSYLTEVVKRVTRRTPGQLIREAQVLEAKRLLARTGLTVVQVARELGFADPAYFCRFFRRETGISPGDFRKGIGGNHHDRLIVSIDAADSLA